MKQFFITMAGVFVGMIAAFVLLPFVVLWVIGAMVAASTAPKALTSASVLELDLRTALTDQEPDNPFASLGRSSRSVLGIEETLRRAEKDDRVKGLLVRLPEGGMAPAAADELRLAIKHFRAAGKPVFAHSQGLFPVGVSTSTYMLGASADQLWMQPGASFETTGVAMEDMFLKRFFDKYGIRPQYEQRYEYKNAVNPYLYDNYTAAHRESQLSWMGSVYQSAVNLAAGDRKRDPDAVRKAIESGPHTAAEAQTLGLIDRVGQVRDIQLAALAKAGDGAKLVDFDDYASATRAPERLGGGDTIAVIDGEGAIVTGTGESAPLFGGEASMRSDDIAKAFYAAIDDRSVKAIVFRLSSPGGSDTASEQILAAVRAAKAAGKPVVVSMGTYGASGGYWVASEASSIIAQPTTLTGSIGVFGGKLAIGDALGKFGVDMRQISVGGPFTGAYSSGATFTPEQRAAFSHQIDTVYEGFIQRVATGRHLDPNRVRQIAKGRVWTGAQARDLGLVDQLGGFYDAVDRAKTLAGIHGQARLKTITTSRSPFDWLTHGMGASAGAVRTLAAAAWVMGDPRAKGLMDQMMDARLRSEGANVLAPRPFR